MNGFDEVNKLAKNNPNIEFILPIHPNPNVQKYKHLLTEVTVIETIISFKIIRYFSKNVS